jgi:tryptophan 2,3-dioxygenase
VSTPTYWDYLKLDRLLALQGGLEDDERRLAPDELHFIVVHQVYELWFKLILSELRLAREHLSAPRVPEESVPFVVHHLRRINEILRLTVEQFRIMETLTPQDFLGFRDKLIPASGFQSFQMRELEILLGLAETERQAYGEAHALDHIRTMAAQGPGGGSAWGRIEAARGETTLRSALHDWLYRTPIRGSSPGDLDDEAVVGAFLAEYVERCGRHAAAQADRVAGSWGGDPAAIRRRFDEAAETARAFLAAEDTEPADRARVKRVRAGLLFIESYRDLPLLAWPRLLVDAIVELEEQLVLWRTRHARMVERTIGRRIGTGGSSGVDYLDQTARYRIFPELWAVRTLLLPRDMLPPLADAGAYGFRR